MKRKTSPLVQGESSDDEDTLEDMERDVFVSMLREMVEPTTKKRKIVSEPSPDFYIESAQSQSMTSFFSNVNLPMKRTSEFDLFSVGSVNRRLRNTPSGSRIRQVVCCGGRTYLWNDLDEVYVENMDKFTQLEILRVGDRIIKLLSGLNLCIVTEKHVIAFKDPFIGYEIESCLPWNEVYIDGTSSVIDHMILLTDKNRIYTSGWNSAGQLGNGTLDSTYNKITLTKTVHPDQVKFLCCGPTYSIYMTESKLYATGQLDMLLGEAGISSVEFSEIRDLPFAVQSVVDIRAGEMFLCILTNIGELHYMSNYPVSRKKLILQNVTFIYPSMSSLIYMCEEPNTVDVYELFLPHETERHLVGSCPKFNFNRICCFQSKILLFHKEEQITIPKMAHYILISGLLTDIEITTGC